MQPSDPMDPQDLQEVRKIIEKSTSKVSLRDLEGKLKELQRRLADEEEARHRAEAQLGTADVTSSARAEELERRVSDAEELAAAAGRKIADLERQRHEREREADTLRRRLEEA